MRLKQYLAITILANSITGMILDYGFGIGEIDIRLSIGREAYSFPVIVSICQIYLAIFYLGKANLESTINKTHILGLIVISTYLLISNNIFNIEAVTGLGYMIFINQYVLLMFIYRNFLKNFLKKNN